MHCWIRPLFTMTSSAGTRPAPSMVGHEALAHRALERAGEGDADLVLLVRREEVDDPVDGLGGVDGVQRRQHEVPGLGGAERGGDRLFVAHLTDEDHVGSWRIAARMADAKSPASTPISRWLIDAR